MTETSRLWLPPGQDVEVGPRIRDDTVTGAAFVGGGVTARVVCSDSADLVEVVMKGPLVLVAGLALAVAACTNVKQVPDETAVRDVIDAQNQELIECWNGGEYECVAAAFSEEGWQMMPNAQAQAGTEAIRRFWQQAFGWGQWEVSMETSLLEQSGPIAVERGKYTIRFAADAAAPPSRPSSQDRGNYVTHWRLDSDGRWRIAAQALASEVPARVVSAPQAPQ